jgi:hypothetical protein
MLGGDDGVGSSGYRGIEGSQLFGKKRIIGLIARCPDAVVGGRNAGVTASLIYRQVRCRRRVLGAVSYAEVAPSACEVGRRLRQTQRELHMQQSHVTWKTPADDSHL